MRTTRRAVLLAGAAFGIAPTLARGAAPGFTAEERATMAQIARDLFPDARFGAARYAAIAHALCGPAADAARVAGWRAGFATLGAGWRHRPAKARLAALKAAQGTPVFADWRANVIVALYHDPATARTIGFPGPSLPFGGYLEQGLNDIAWLAEPTA